MRCCTLQVGLGVWSLSLAVVDPHQGFVKMMRKRVSEIAATGPLGGAPTPPTPVSTSRSAHHRTHDVSDNEKSTQPMYCWDPAWPQYVGLAQQVVRASLVGDLPDGDRVGVRRCPVALQLANWVCFAESRC